VLIARTKLRTLLLFATAFGLNALLAVSAMASVTPESKDFGELEPGYTSETITKTITVPEATPKLDFVLLVDHSGSYRNDLPNIKSVAPGLYDDLKSESPDLQVGLTTFIDFPFSPWGGSTDYAYRLEQDLTTTKTTWTSAINAMSAGGGSDGPESQYEGLYQTASGAGRDINGDGDYTDKGEIAPGLGINWRPDATKVIAITTDASFHNPTDSGGTYPGPSKAQTIAALNAEGITVIALKAPGATTQMDDIATATGGSVQSTTSTSSNIAAAILAGLEELEATVSGSLTSCDSPVDLTLNLTPASIAEVAAGETVTMTESITVGAGALPGEYSCVVTFTWGDTSIGTQTITFEVPSGNTPPVLTVPTDVTIDATGPAGADYDAPVSATDAEDDDSTLVIDCVPDLTVYPLGSTTVNCSVVDSGGLSDSGSFTVTVVDNTAPLATCDETTNSSGKNTPKAGKNAGKSGQNPDGFYLLGGSDGESGLASLVLTDTGSDAAFSFDPGTSIKLIQANGATPNVKPGSGSTDWKVQLKGDGVVVATDNVGNTSSTTCRVPQPPK